MPRSSLFTPTTPLDARALLSAPPLALPTALQVHCPIDRPWLDIDGLPATIVPPFAIRQRAGLVEILEFTPRPLDAAPGHGFTRHRRFADAMAALMWACTHNHLLLCDSLLSVYDMATGTRWHVPADCDFMSFVHTDTWLRHALAAGDRQVHAVAGVLPAVRV